MRIVSLLLAFASVVLSGDMLVRVEPGTAALATPGFAFLRDLGSSVVGRADGPAVHRLRETGTRVTVLDASFRTGEYFLVPHTKLNPAGAPGAVLHDDSRQAIVRLDEREAAMFQDAGWLLVPLPRRGLPPAPAANPPLDWQPDTAVARMAGMVSLDTLMRDIRHLQDFVTRYTYSPKCESAGLWLADEFAGLGWEVAIDTYRVSGTRALNIEATLDGTVRPDSIVIACAHYDSYTEQGMTNAPGADDNATGTAILLELARVLATSRFRRTVKLLAFSGEEQWMKGSYHWVDSVAVPQGMDIEVAFNVDMIGYDSIDGNECVINTNSRSRPFAVLAESANHWYDIDLVLLNYLDPDCYGDNTPFWEAGFASTFALEDSEWGIWNGSNPHYHTTHDTTGFLSPDVVLGVGRLTAACVATVAEPDGPTALAEPGAGSRLRGPGVPVVFCGTDLDLPGRWVAWDIAGKRAASGEAGDLLALAPGVYHLVRLDRAEPARRLVRLR